MTDTLARSSGRHAAPFRDDAPTAPTGTLVLARTARHREQPPHEPDPLALASVEPKPLAPHRRLLRRVAGERGAATAEYAVATMAAVGFAGLLIVILRGDEVRGILTELVRNALTVG